MPINAQQIEAYQLGYRQAEMDRDVTLPAPTKWKVTLTFESGRVKIVMVTSETKPFYSGRTDWWQVKPELQVNMTKVETVEVTTA